MSTLEIRGPQGPSRPQDAVVAYFHRTAAGLLRPVRGIFRHPSISATLPGSTYATELWDWDTYWTSRGLVELARRVGDRRLLEQICRHAEGSLFNFFDHQSPDGRIPLMIGEAAPDPFGCLRNGGAEMNQAKPIFGQLALLVAEARQDAAWMEPRFEALLLFYDSWTARYRSHTGLLVWGNDILIGVDNDPTTYGRPPFSSANLMLNCLFYQDLRAASEIAGRLKKREAQARLIEQARELGLQIRKHCWDPRDRFYYTVDVQCIDRRRELLPNHQAGMAMGWNSLPLRIQTFTGFLPLWCGLADRGQAADLVLRHYDNAATFHAAYGVRTLSAQETMYSMAFSSNPSNWLGPIWLLANYLVWKGLKAYRFDQEAADLAARTLRLVAADIAASGTLHEYYHPDTGAPLSHSGFMDWNLLVLEMM